MIVKVINKSQYPLPTYSSKGSAGMDVRANLESSITLKAGERTLIPTGLYFEIPEGYEIQVRPRSGLALKHGITVLNSPGTLDNDYRGEVGVILINTSKDDFTINPGERVAQLVLAKVDAISFEEVEELTKTDRGDGGFGHSGRN